MSTFTGDSRIGTELMYPNRRPTIPVKIDLNDPLAKWYDSFILLNKIFPTDLVRYEQFSPAGTPSISGGDLDLSATSTYIDKNSGGLSFPFTLSVMCARSSGGFHIGYANTGIDTDSIGLQYDNVAGLRGFVYATASGFKELLSDTQPALGELVVTSFVVPSGDMTTWKIYLNGKDVTVATTGTSTIPTTINTFSVGSLARLNRIIYGGTKYKFCSTILRALSAAEIRTMHSNVYQSLTPDIGA